MIIGGESIGSHVCIFFQVAIRIGFRLVAACRGSGEEGIMIPTVQAIRRLDLPGL